MGIYDISSRWKADVLESAYGILPRFEDLTTTLNPSDKSTTAVLSNNNLTITSSAGNASARSTYSTKTGKYYVESVIDARTNSDNWCFGVTDSSYATGNDPYGATATQGFGFYAYNSSGVAAAGSNFAASVSWSSPAAVGDTICLAFDIDAKLYWFRINNGNWNNSGTANPATGTGGVSFSSVTGALFVVQAADTVDTNKATLRFNTASWAYAAPSDFVQFSDNEPSADFTEFMDFFNRSVQSGSYTSQDIVTTYSLVYTTTTAYAGGVLAPNGDIHFVPYSAVVGQKVSSSGTVSTYSLVYTTSAAYWGGVLAPNGDIHFVPYNAPVGQKISPAGVVSTYSLTYTTTTAYSGGVISSTGDIHFIPYSAIVGQKISAAGVVSTYSLVYTGATATGGVLSSDGSVHFIARSANRGQKISAAGVVSTYTLIYTALNAYAGGAISTNGDIHLACFNGSVGQKISAAGVVSTYTLVRTALGTHTGSVLAPNGDIHFIPNNAPVGQKISSAGVVSTYSLVYTVATAYNGGILAPNGDIHFVPYSAVRGQKIITSQGITPDIGICASPYLNKF